MSVQKSSREAHSKPSAATAPTSSTINTNPHSSLLKSAFSPSQLQLSLFASVIQGFESQHLRIHETNTGRLRCEHATGAGTRIASLDWGYYGTTYRDQSHQSAKKKRKRDSTHAGSAVVAFGTSQSEICMFSPSEGKVTGRLSGPHERGIRDFKFYGEDYLGGWSVGGDGKLVQWDLRTNQAIRSITLPDAAISTLVPVPRSIVETSIPSASAGPAVICASATPYSVTLLSSTDHRIDKFDSFKKAVHGIIQSGPRSELSNGFFLAANSDRYINMFDIAQQRLSRTLVVGSGVESLSMSALESQSDPLASQLLAVTTEAGTVELFSDPFQEPPKQAELSETTKSKRKGLTRKAAASIKLIRPDSKGIIVPVFQTLVHGPEVFLASADGGVDVSFQKVRWMDDGTGELLFDGTREVFRSKSATSLNKATMNGVKDVVKTHADESRVVVVDASAGEGLQDAVIEISSDDEIIEDAEEESAENAQDKSNDEGVAPEDTEISDPDEALIDGPEQGHDENELEENEQATEPTFGELLAASNPEAISISDALVPAGSTALAVKVPEKGLSTPSGVSLSTVLTQSLRTNDQNLLESCFHTTDLNTIRLTIQRLDSSLAGILIQRLAERLSSRPGRYGHLLVWVQWTCIVHGGIIAGHPEVAPKIKILYKVLNERSRSLDNLLLLKGKLDMLDAQLTLRRQLQVERGSARDPEDEDDIIYIEGQDDHFSSDEDETGETTAMATKPRPGKKALRDLAKEDAESEDDEAMPLTNGVLHSDDDGDGADSGGETAEREDDGLVDDEALESNNESRPSEQEEEEEEEEEDSDEVDSEMDSFIDDDSVELESANDTDVDETPEKPLSKKARRG